MTLASSGESGERLRRPLLARLPDALRQHARLEVAADEAQHLLVVDTPCHPRPQGVVLDALEEGVRVEVDHERRTIGDGLARARDRLVRRAPRPEAERALVEVRVEDGAEHLQQGLLDQSIQGRRHPHNRVPPEGLGISTLVTGCGR